MKREKRFLDEKRNETRVLNFRRTYIKLLWSLEFGGFPFRSKIIYRVSYLTWDDERAGRADETSSFYAKNKMFRQSSASCGVKSVSDDDIHSLVVIADDRHDISLFHFGSSRSLSATCSPDADFRLLSRWYAGDDDDQSGRPLGISCILALDGIAVTVVFTNNRGTFCRILTFSNDFRESLREDLLELTFLGSGCHNPVPNAKNLIILQNSHMVVLVLDDDSLLVSTRVGGIPMTEIDPVVEDKAVSNSTSNNKFKPRTLDCHKLPTLSTSNKAYKSLRSDEMIIRQICAGDFSESTVLVFLVQSESALDPNCSHTTC